MSMNGKRKREDMDATAIPLATLMEAEAEEASDYEVVEEEKPKRKRKPKPEVQMRTIPVAFVVGVAALLIGFVGAVLFMFVAPVQESSVIVAQPVEQSVPAVPQLDTVNSNPLVDRWMLLQTGVGEIPANTFVRVLSQDNAPEYYNVADLQGHLTIVLGSALVEGAGAPSVEVFPPPGPYAAALGSTQKSLVTVEWNGDLPAGSAVYAMGWRAEDGTWVYEVSPDRVKVYYLPAGHLRWADNVRPTG